MADYVCFDCFKSQSELVEPLRRCSRCQLARYCSTDCQRANWSQHKRSCTRSTTSRATENRLRATVRLREGRIDLPAEDDIFYVKKISESPIDMTIAGPFHPCSAMVEQIRYYLHDTSQAGMSLFEDIAEDEATLAQLQHIHAPLDYNPNKFIFIEVITLHDPTMARILPGPSYNVYIMKPTHATESTEPSLRPKNPAMEIEVHGSFANVEQANAKAEECAQSIERNLQSCKRMGPERRERGETYLGLACVNRNGHRYGMVIEVRYDSGVIKWT